MKLSVIVPVYNVEKYLERCVNSIIGQTYKDLEIILVDDGSTDNSGQLCDSYIKKDSRIKVIHKKNGGLSDARNVGINIAQGGLIAFVDSDDWIDVDMYEKMISALVKYNVDIVECDYREVFVDHVEERKNIPEEIVCGDNLYALEQELQWGYFKAVVWNKIYKIHLFENIRFPVGKVHEDEFTTYKLYYKASRLVHINTTKYNYDKTRSESITGTFKEAKFDACEALREKVRFFDKKGMNNLKIKSIDRYLYTLLDTITKSYESNLNSPRREAFINDLRNNYLELINMDISYQYKIDLTILQISVKLFVECKKDECKWETLRNSLEEKQWLKYVNKPLYSIAYNENEIEDLLQEDEKTDDVCFDVAVYKKGLERLLDENKDVIIYGAGVLGTGLYQWIKNAGLEKNVKAFAVTTIRVNKDNILGVPLFEISKYAEDITPKTILIAAKAWFREEMYNTVKGYRNAQVLILNEGIIKSL